MLFVRDVITGDIYNVFLQVKVDIRSNSNVWPSLAAGPTRYVYDMNFALEFETNRTYVDLGLQYNREEN